MYSIAANPSFKAFSRILGVLAVSSVLLLPAGGAPGQPIILLSDDKPMQDISASSVMWVYTTEQSSATQVMAGRVGLNFSPSKTERVCTLRRGLRATHQDDLISQIDSSLLLAGPA